MGYLDFRLGSVSSRFEIRITDRSRSHQTSVFDTGPEFWRIQLREN